MQAQISFSTKTGFQASGSGVPVPTQQVTTQTPIRVAGTTPSCPASFVARQQADGSLRCQPFLVGAQLQPVTTMAYSPVRAAAPSQAVTAPARADLLKRYGLWAVVGLAAAVVLYKVVKK